jgi:MFS family permease
VATPHEAKPGFYPWYVAGLLGIAYAVAFVDRQVLNLLVEPIKHGLGFSDVQVSLLQGGAFVVAYVAMGAVFGRLADQTNRRNLLIGGVVAWSLCTMLCGFCNSFFTLFAARAGIGAAEACLLPAGWSLLSDYFSRERLPRAMSIFLTGPFIGGGLALISGGLILQRMTTELPSAIWSGFAPWQRTFMVVGSPGLLVALLLLSVREPARVVPVRARDASFRLREVGAFLWNERAFYGRFFGGMALLIVGLYALPAWTPSLLIRVYGGTPGRVGVEYGTATLIASSLGVLLGPWISNRLSAWYPNDSPLRTAVCAGLFAAAACLLLPFAPNYWTVLFESVMGSFFLNFAIPVAAAALQASTPNRMRGLMTSAYAFVLAMVGLGFAPTLIALLTEHVLQNSKRIGDSLGWVCGLAALSSIPLLLRAATYYVSRIAVERAFELPINTSIAMRTDTNV